MPGFLLKEIHGRFSIFFCTFKVFICVALVAYTVLFSVPTTRFLCTNGLTEQGLRPYLAFWMVGWLVILVMGVEDNQGAVESWLSACHG
jgi:hypothetical protein